MRKAINVLQATASSNKEITDKEVFNVSARARPEEVKKLIFLAYNGYFKDARDMLYKLMYDYGMSGEDIIGQIYRELVELEEKEIDTKEKIRLIEIVSEYNFRITQGANERLQLEAMFAQFSK